MGAVFRAGTILVGTYRLDDLLGRDGTCLVFHATHLQAGVELIVQLFVPETATNLSAHVRFCQEAQAASRLQGEHVSRVMDAGVLPDGVPYVVTEAVRGVSLAELVRRGPLPPAVAVDCVAQLCEALAEAHAYGIAPAHLGPATVFLTARPDGTALVKVIDLGLAKTAAAGHAVLTGSAPAVGVAAYLAPEHRRATGLSGLSDPRADVWTLGAVLHECLTGQPPWSGPSSFAVGRSAMTPRHAMDPSIPEALQAVVWRCLETDREARFASVAALAAALAPFAYPHGTPAAFADHERVLAHGATAVAAAPEPRGAPRPGARRSRRVAIIGATTLAVSICGIAVAALIQPGESRGATGSLVRPNAAVPAPAAVAPAPTAVAPAPTAVAPAPAAIAPAPAAVAPPPAVPPTASAPTPAVAPAAVLRTASLPTPAPRAAAIPAPAAHLAHAAAIPAPAAHASPERTAVARADAPDPTPPAAPAARTSRCDTVDVDSMMTRAAIQYDSGTASSALSLTRTALNCRHTERMYWLAVLYACAAHDLASARLYFANVPANLQSGLETKCQREGLGVRGP